MQKTITFVSLVTKGRTSYQIGDQNALHYLTMATVSWVDLFTRHRNKDIIIESLQFCREIKGLEIYGYCIMTNHTHLIYRAKEGYTLSDILRDFKRHTAKHLLRSINEEPESRREWILAIFEDAGSKNQKNKKYQVWRQDNHPNNPVEEGIVQNAEDYLYSSARNYAHSRPRLRRG